VWPNLNIPTGMPLECYCTPYLVTALKHYDPDMRYRNLVRIRSAITSWSALVRRVAGPAPLAVRFAHGVKTLSFLLFGR